MERPDPVNKEALASYRLLCFVVATVVAVLGVLRSLRPGEFVDPLWARSLVALAFLTAPVLSFVHIGIRRRFPSVFLGLCFLLSGWTAWLAALNQLEPSLVTMFELVVLVAGLAFGVIGVSARALHAFLGFNALGAILAATSVEESRTNPSVFVAGLVGCMVAVLVVVSLYRQMRRRQQDAEEQWRAVVSGHPDAILVHVDGRVVFGNERALRLFDLTEPEILRSSIEDLLPPLPASLGTSSNTEVELTTATGERRHFAVRWAPARFEGAGAVLLRLADRTEEIERLRLLEAAQAEAQAAAEAKSSFLAIVSHEIRTPLNGIIGLTDVLAEEPLNERSQECVRLLRSSGDSLLMIINDILDFSKAEGGHLVLEQAPFDIRDVTRFCVEVMMSQTQEKGIGFGFLVDEDVPTKLLGDSLRVRQILLNLVSNACKFTSEGEVRGHISRRLQGPGIRIEVRDTGIGIPSERLEQLFEPFRQAEASTTRRFGGTGLGLSICRQLAELMGGRISVQSAPGEGSCFTVELPLSVARGVSQLEAVPTRAGAASALRVLLAEDNLVNQKVAASMLKRMGHEVMVVETGVEVLSIMEDQSFDVVLMDMMMPEMGGCEASEALRARSDLPQPRIVALTANALDEDRARCLAAGMDDFLAKPLRRVELEAVLAKVVSAPP